ncbi:unnamed protein product [Meganyctiphanes norvegica]|uniref:Zinc transporter ZIP14 n=1 Tax=Meganyctiphanes norvegica TaxID=48144 RepID=A0AAV2QSM6_MEGNR
MLKLEKMIIHILCIVCYCLMSHAASTPPTYTIESHNESSTNSLLESLWKIEWGPLPKNPADVNTILWYSLSKTTGKVDIETIDLLRECLIRGKNCKDVLPKDPSGPMGLLTNCTINTALSPAFCNALQKCTDTSGLLTSLGKDGDTVTVSELDKLLPVLMYQASEGHCQGQENDSQAKTNKKPQPGEVWGYGILFVTLISGCSLAGVSVLPLIGRHFYQQLLTTLVGLAVGSLAASALFHLIPQAFHMHETTGNHDYLFISLYVLLGIWGFFMVERLIKIVLGNCSKNEDKKPLPMSGSAQAMLYDGERECGNGPHSPNGNGNVCGNGKVAMYDANTTSLTCGSHDVQQIYQSQEQAIKASFGHDERPGKDDHHSHQIEFHQGKDSVIKTVAWMIIFGDGFHNFIDGVSIGAAFSESILTGVSISLAVMCEELPHELGDFAVLLNAGMTMKQAVMYNFLSATTCYLGLVLGIVLGEFTQNSSAIFALAAGMFLYIALTDMIPEMNEVASKANSEGMSSALLVLLLQNIGIFIGIASLFILAYFQDSITIG